MDEGKKLSIIEHLEELRDRLIKSIVGVAVTTAISFFFARQLFAILLGPSGGIKPVFIEVTEMFTTYMKVAFFSGLSLAMPVIVYQLVMFASPAMTPKEKRYLYMLLPGVILSFLVGAAFGYFLVVPRALQFLLNFGIDIATPQIKIGNYISVVTSLLFWMGVVFEAPLVAFFLAKIHVLNHKMLAKNRKYALLGAFVVAAIITPTPDPLNQAIVAVPLFALYEISIWLTRLA